ncbi:MAG: hypothetical protein QGF61_04335 [Pelagibacteraceae bacterium]|jgi:hypothetical protein|nr:hypothetical protein [Pelagibacteraceae bacterium]|tara:strand:- start:2455 stop:2886 length:432 start_codon:yes stop_codon:yes gene_type:complete
MIEKVLRKKRLFALIIRRQFRKKSGINFFTSKDITQQIGFMKHKKNHFIKPHKHNKRLTRILGSTEVILLLKGTLRVDFYNNDNKYLLSKIINEGDILMLIYGGHGFKVLKNVEMIEVKQGPYSLTGDKVKFKTVDEKKIKFK